MLVPYHNTESPFLERLLTECEHHLEDEEARVRYGPYDRGRKYANIHPTKPALVFPRS